MKRTTISLPDDLAVLLLRDARRRDQPVSEVVRQAIASYLGLSPVGQREIPFAALGASGQEETSVSAEEILEREWERDCSR